MQTEQLLCWSGITDMEHTTSGSNEGSKAVIQVVLVILVVLVIEVVL